MNVDGKRSCRGAERFRSGCASAVAGVVLLFLAWGASLRGQDYYVQNWHLDEGLPDGDITAIQQTPDGFLWVGTPKGLARFDRLQFKVFSADNTPGLSDSRISSLLTDSEGTLWIGTLDGNLVRRREGSFESMHPPLRDAPGLKAEERPGSWLWSRRIQLTEVGREKERPQKTSLPQVGTDLIQDHEGALWWRVSGQGLMRFKAGQWGVFSATNGLPVEASGARTFLSMRVKRRQAGIWPCCFWEKRAEAGGPLERLKINSPFAERWLGL